MDNGKTATGSGSSRRGILGAAAGAGLVAAAPGQALAQAAPRPQAQRSEPASTPPIMRPAGRTGETLPALGLGTFLTFDRIPGDKRDDLREVMKIYLDAGVRVVDTSPLYGTGETSVGHFINAFDVGDTLFLADKLWTTGDYLADESHAIRSFEQSQNRLWRARFDLMQIHSLVNVDIALPILQAWKKEGRTRLIGVTHHENEYHDVLAKWIETGSVDFVQVNYSIANRNAEARVLRAAADRGVAVLTNMSLEKGRLHKVVGDRPLPPFAAEIGAATWAQFFLKFAMSHPAVTCVLCATSNPAHAADNVGALRGALPDADLRARMVRHMESLPGLDGLARMPWYPDKQAQYQGVIRRSQATLRRRAT